MWVAEFGYDLEVSARRILAVSLTEIGAEMTGRAFERSQVEPLPFPLHVSSYASPAIKGYVDADAAFDPETDCPSDEYPTAGGCLRGFRWAIGIEAATGLIVFTVWHFRHLLW